MRAVSEDRARTRVGRHLKIGWPVDEERTVIRSVSLPRKRYALELDAEDGELPEEYEEGAPRVLMRF